MSMPVLHVFTTATPQPEKADGSSNENGWQCHHRAYQYSTPPPQDVIVEAGCTCDCRADGETYQDLGRSRRARWWLRRFPPQRKAYPRIRPSQQDLMGCGHARRKNQQDNAKNYLENGHGGIMAWRGSSPQNTWQVPGS